jgi:WD40 repeat protein
MGHRDEVYDVIIIGDGTRFLSVSGDRSIRLWSLDHLMRKTKLPLTDSYFVNVVPDPTGNTVAYAARQRLDIISLDNWALETSVDEPTPERKFLHDVTWNSNKPVIATGTERMVYGGPQMPGNSRGVHEFTSTTPIMESDDTNKRAVTGLGAFSASGRSIAWGFNNSEHAIKFSRQNTTQGVPPADTTGICLEIWDLKKKEIQLEIACDDELVEALAFCQNDKSVAFAGTDHSIKVINIQSGQPVHHFAGHRHIVLSLRTDRESRYLASTSLDSTARIWDLVSGQLVSVLESHEGRVTDAAFSQDSRRIFTVSIDGTFRVWNVSTGDLLLTLQDPDLRGYMKLAGIPDSQRVLVATSTGIKVLGPE